jgi:hypothetical protein
MDYMVHQKQLKGNPFPYPRTPLLFGPQSDFLDTILGKSLSEGLSAVTGKINLLEQHWNFDRDQRPEPEPAKLRSKSHSRLGGFENPLDDVSTRDKAQSVGTSLVAGQYIRRTFTFTPGQLERVKDIARELHISETGIARWLIDVGLTAWNNGLRPEVEEKEARLEPKLRHCRPQRMSR